MENRAYDSMCDFDPEIVFLIFHLKIECINRFPLCWFIEKRHNSKFDSFLECSTTKFRNCRWQLWWIYYVSPFFLFVVFNKYIVKKEEMHNKQINFIRELWNLCKYKEELFLHFFFGMKIHEDNNNKSDLTVLFGSFTIVSWNYYEKESLKNFFDHIFSMLIINM